MNTGRVLLAVFGALTVILGVVSVVEYDQSVNPAGQSYGTTQTVFSTRTSTHTVFQTVFQTRTITEAIRSPFYYAASNVTIPLEDILGNQTFNTGPYFGNSSFVVTTTTEPPQTSCPSGTSCTYNLSANTTIFYTGPYSELFTFNVTTILPPPCYCPPEATCTCTIGGPTTLVFDVTNLVQFEGTYQGETYTTQRVTFAWWGPGIPLPQPSNATLFGGEVNLTWLKGPSQPELIYLNVWVNATVA